MNIEYDNKFMSLKILRDTIRLHNRITLYVLARLSEIC